MEMRVHLRNNNKIQFGMDKERDATFSLCNVTVSTEIDKTKIYYL